MGEREQGREGGRKDRSEKGREGQVNTDQHADKPVVVNQRLCYSSPSVGADSDSPKFQGRELQILL